jgi:hypothetical protein
MLEYVLCALLGFVMIGGLLYVSFSPEAEDAPKRPGRKRYGQAIGKELAALGRVRSHRPESLKSAYSSRTPKITIKQST